MTADELETTEVLGVPVHGITKAAALHLIESFSRTGRFYQVTTVNPEFIMRAQRDPEFMEVLRSASLSIPDGIGVVHAARLLGTKLPERVTGVDLVEGIASLAARKGLRLFFLGAAPGIAERAAQALLQKNPGLLIAGTHAGSPLPEEEQSIIRRIKTAAADILFVAYGAPQQDLWIARNGEHTGASVAIGVGGSFDFIAEVSQRAPRWVQALGLEWLHRLVREPWRWKRMLALPRFAAAVLAQSLTGHGGKVRPPLSTTPGGNR